MFGVDSGELFIIVLIAVVVIGPKDLPRVMRTIGNWVGKARAMSNQFRSGVDQMVRDSEIADLERKWREQNEAIMRAHPAAPPESDWGLPADQPPPQPEALALPVPSPAPASTEASTPPAGGSARRPPAHVPPLLKPAPLQPRGGAEPELP